MDDSQLFFWVGTGIILYIVVVVVEVGMKLWRYMK